MEFEHFINEKLADDLSTDQLDNYWKAISAYNTWKRNKKNPMKVKNMLSFILHEYPLDDRAKAKIQSLFDTVVKFMDTGEDTTTIQKRNPKEPSDKPAKQPEYDVNDFQEIELTQDFLESAYKKFNTKYFNNALPDIPLFIAKGDDQVGAFKYSIDWGNKRITPIDITVDPKLNKSLSAFRNTLVHEMLHFYVDCFVNHFSSDIWANALFLYLRGKTSKWKSLLKCSDAQAHGGEWLRLAKKLNNKYPELGITRNCFVSNNENKDKLSLIEQLKDAYIVDVYETQAISAWKTKIYHKYRLATGTDFRYLQALIKDGKLVYNSKNENAIENFTMPFGIYLFGGIYHLSASKIDRPIALATFPISDISQRVFHVGDQMFKQMKHTKAFKPLKELGTFRPVKEENESTDPDFKTWLNEKTSPKWDIEKLKEMGLTDEEIERLLSGEENEICTIS